MVQLGAEKNSSSNSDGCIDPNIYTSVGIGIDRYQCNNINTVPLLQFPQRDDLAASACVSAAPQHGAGTPPPPPCCVL